MFSTIDEIKFANKNAGFKFFREDTLEFFGSKILNKVYGGRFFVTSELNFEGNERYYTLRVADIDGDIDTVGEFNQYPTEWAAKRAALYCEKFLAEFLSQENYKLRENAEILLEGVEKYETYFAN